MNNIKEIIVSLKTRVALAELIGPDEMIVSASDLSTLIAQLEAAQKELSAANEKLKGEQVPVFEVEMSCGHWLNMGPISGADLSKLPDGINKLFTAPQKPVVLSSSTVMSRAYVVRTIKAAGFKVEGE
ncbi:TPA: hypothetical protein ACKWS1_004288 [Yersinia enterocolitica]